eukprot:m.293708 g.293708  ORF g.293708 m.293708 type:complete len:335 (+) comp19495_c1_seq1:1030-2034(+)
MLLLEGYYCYSKPDCPSTVRRTLVSVFTSQRKERLGTTLLHDDATLFLVFDKSQQHARHLLSGVVAVRLAQLDQSFHKLVLQQLLNSLVCKGRRVLGVRLRDAFLGQLAKSLELFALLCFFRLVIAVGHVGQQVCHAVAHGFLSFHADSVNGFENGRVGCDVLLDFRIQCQVGQALGGPSLNVQRRVLTNQKRAEFLGQVDCGSLSEGAHVDCSAVHGSHLAQAYESTDTNRVWQVLAVQGLEAAKRFRHDALDPLRVRRSVRDGLGRSALGFAILASGHGHECLQNVAFFQDLVSDVNHSLQHCCQSVARCDIALWVVIMKRDGRLAFLGKHG